MMETGDVLLLFIPLSSLTITTPVPFIGTDRTTNSVPQEAEVENGPEQEDSSQSSFSGCKTATAVRHWDGLTPLVPIHAQSQANLHLKASLAGTHPTSFCGLQRW